MQRNKLLLVIIELNDQRLCVIKLLLVLSQVNLEIITMATCLPLASLVYMRLYEVEPHSP
jgi:hypothetical protein